MYRCKDGMKLSHDQTKDTYGLRCNEAKKDFLNPVWPTCVGSKQLVDWR